MSPLNKSQLQKFKKDIVKALENIIGIKTKLGIHDLLIRILDLNQENKSFIRLYRQIIKQFENVDTETMKESENKYRLIDCLNKGTNENYYKIIVYVLKNYVTVVDFTSDEKQKLDQSLMESSSVPAIPEINADSVSDLHYSYQPQRPLTDTIQCENVKQLYDDESKDIIVESSINKDHSRLSNSSRRSSRNDKQYQYQNQQYENDTFNQTQYMNQQERAQRFLQSKKQQEQSRQLQAKQFYPKDEEQEQQLKSAQVQTQQQTVDQQIQIEQQVKNKQSQTDFIDQDKYDSTVQYRKVPMSQTQQSLQKILDQQYSVSSSGQLEPAPELDNKSTIHISKEEFDQVEGHSQPQNTVQKLTQVEPQQIKNTQQFTQQKSENIEQQIQQQSQIKKSLYNKPKHLFKTQISQESEINVSKELNKVSRELKDQKVEDQEQQQQDAYEKIKDEVTLQTKIHQLQQLKQKFEKRVNYYNQLLQQRNTQLLEELAQKSIEVEDMRNYITVRIYQLKQKCQYLQELYRTGRGKNYRKAQQLRMDHDQLVRLSVNKDLIDSQVQQLYQQLQSQVQQINTIKTDFMNKYNLYQSIMQNSK